MSSLVYNFTCTQITQAIKAARDGSLAHMSELGSVAEEIPRTLHKALIEMYISHLRCPRNTRGRPLHPKLGETTLAALEVLKCFAHHQLDSILANDTTGDLARVIIGAWCDIRLWYWFFKNNLERIETHGISQEESSQVAICLISASVNSLCKVEMLRDVILADDVVYSVILTLWLKQDVSICEQLPKIDTSTPTLALQTLLGDATSDRCHDRLRRIQPQSLADRGSPNVLSAGLYVVFVL